MKKRIDVLLVDMGFFESREQARRNIMAGNVFVDNQKIDKAGTAVRIDSEIIVKGKPIPYVSRGGLKLEKALNNFDLTLDGKICMDIGASTGGFTDCMLQNGATKVYSIDVGYGQLAWKLRQDKRVVCMERQNIRHLEVDSLGDRPDFASIDVSFISLRLVLPKAWEILNKKGRIVALIKPQFEAGREKVGKKGVVREKSTHVEVIDFVSKIAIKEGFRILELDFSPIKGPEGNIEYLIYLEKINEKPDMEKIENTNDFDGEKNKVIFEFASKYNSLDKYKTYDEYYDKIVELVEASHSLDK
ncbi:TlyA family RNA methyltransferase [Peptostreptococcus canis]|uniref:TlyA family RNA methyltransferase n=1 Tax=Peptostreptococcus canis TaxID=1159213 RepID=A0ABR6TME3_9FIRM|nr:TlyA family RNA methyltransferase [Peptostreptococcus canis]MBC2576490.1 TlyA family RNA methyltransferase [Peptostreptococcus canis]MBP1998674.1 23S rRNA (cytidine1920-2'-O)/16S rRNA (cytidine1409-2'-O)-methyltransferase [Peptostreptococcus canis]